MLLGGAAHYPHAMCPTTMWYVNVNQKVQLSLANKPYCFCQWLHVAHLAMCDVARNQMITWNNGREFRQENMEYTNHIWLEGFIEIIARVFPLTPDCKEGVNEDECNNFDKARHHKCD